MITIMETALVCSIAAAVLFLLLYGFKRQDCKALERENRWLREQRDRMPEPVSVDDMDQRPLDRSSAMDAIRYNGFVPESVEHWITFMSKGEQYVIDADRFPVLIMMKSYKVDWNELDMDLMRKAAHQVSDELIMAKVLFLGEEEDQIAFQIEAIESKYGHFKDCLIRYIGIIEESHARMDQIYNDMAAKQIETTIPPQLGIGVSNDKKLMS